jgi:hypothetical protein
MALMLWTNNAKTTLAGSIVADATSANLASGTGALFPSPTGGNYFALTFIDAATKLISEIVYVTARSSDTITMTRAQEGTTARAWTAGDIAANLWTAGAAALAAQPPQLQQQTGNYAVDSGTLNAAVVTLSPAPAALSALAGAALRVKKMASANTGAITLAVNGLTATAIVHADGTAISAGELPASGVFSVVFDGTNFVLQSVAGAAGGVTSAQLQSQAGNYAVDSGTTNAAAVTLAPIPSGLAALVGSPIRVKKIASINTGAISLSVNGLTAKSIKLPDGTDPLSGMLAASGVFTVVYDGTNFVLQSTPTGLAPLNAPALVNPTATTPTAGDRSQKVVTTEWAADEIQQQTGNYAVDTGAGAGSNAVVINLVPTPASLTALIGVPIRFKKTGTNGFAATTLTVNGFTTKFITYSGNTGYVSAGALLDGSIYTVVYNGTAFQLQSEPDWLSNVSGASTSGYLQLPNKLLMQWMRVSVADDNTGTFNLPYTFASTNFACFATVLDGAAMGTNVIRGATAIPASVGSVTVAYEDTSGSPHTPANIAIFCIGAGV